MVATTILTKDAIQQRRNPSELREFAELVCDYVRHDQVELNKGTCKTGLYKEFLDEILPLSYFAEIAYPNDFTVQPVIGNQGFDAIVYNGSGIIHEKLELTTPHDGFTSASVARTRNKIGYSTAFIGNIGEDFIRITPFVLATCRSKSLKDYSNVKLVIIVNVQPPFEGYEENYKFNVSHLVELVSKIQFVSKNLVLFFPPSLIEKIY